MCRQVSIATDRVRLSLRGAFVEDAAGLLARPLRGAALQLDTDGPTERLGLAEETTYTVWVESLGTDPVEIRHADPVVTAALRSERSGQIVTGTLRFGSHVGRVRLLVLVAGQLELEILAGVAPRKVTWDTVHALREEVEAAWAGLPLAALRPTQDARASEIGGAASTPAWLAILRARAEALDTALREITHRPIREVQRRRQLVRASRVTRSDSTVRASVRRAGGLSEHLEAQPTRLTLDTSAHRWLSAGLDRVTAKLRRLHREESRRRTTDRRRAILEELEQVRRQLERHGARGPLAEAFGPAPSVPPLVLRRRPAYAAAYAALRQLEGSLARAEGDLRPSLLDLAGLYEAWCALVLVRETAEVLGAEPPRVPFGVHRAGVDVRLRRGSRAAVRLEGNGIRVTIAYSPRFASPQALLAQRPDLLLTVQGRTTHRIVLDAKYRREDNATRYGIAGPPTDAIGALHRYRDAILGPDGAAGWIDGAVALFPPADLEGYEQSRLWTGLADIGIGAVPLVPGQTAWLRRWLERTVREVA